MSTIHDRLAKVRAMQGLQPAELAEVVAGVGCEVSHQSVRNYESGKTEKIPADYIAALAELYRINPTWLVLGEGPMLRQDEDDRMRLEVIAAIANRHVRSQEVAPLLRSTQRPEDPGDSST